MLTTIILCAVTFFLGVFLGALLIQLDNAKKQAKEFQAKNTDLEDECNDLANSKEELHEILQEQNTIIESYIGAKARQN
jgi:uncharacterized membrane-anchored protein YhcB (DUF1043 family)